DVEGRRSVDAAADAAHEVLANARGMDVIRQISGERLQVEPDLRGVGTEIRVGELPLVLVENVVHLPEPSLGRSRFGGFGGLFGMRVRRRDREVAEDELQPVAHPVLY